MNALHVLAWFGEEAVRLVDENGNGWLRPVLSGCLIRVCTRETQMELARYAITPWGELLLVWERTP